MSKKPRKYFGHAGHFICGDRCRFHICTLIGNVVVSSVGDYRERHDDKKPQEIGYNRLYETFVFKRDKGSCGCGCGLPRIIPSEIDSLAANDAPTATKNHETLCRKWESK